MKILVFLGNDAANLSIESIVRELLVRHEVKVISTSTNAQQIQMYQDIAEKIRLSSSYTDEDIEWADCIFCTVMSATILQDCKKYIFSFCHMNPRFDEPRGYDFVFTLSELGDQDVPPYFASMPVGLAKNDVPVTATPKKQILYVDAGHFPFGKTGQRQIAEMLLKICQAYPDYNVCVKPRWFPNITADEMLNPNYGHLYTALEELCPDGLPANLELLREYRNLQELIDESACVISSCTSAYLDAAMRGKPLLIIKGIQNEDMYHLRNAYYENLYRFAEGSGCVVDYREVISYLPEGKICDPRHIQQSFSYLNGATERVVTAMEYIYEHFISQGRYPDIREYRYETFRDELTDSTHLRFEQLLCNRRFCATETSLILTYKISYTLDWQPYYQQQLELCRSSLLPGSNLYEPKRLSQEVEKLKCQYIVDHPEFIKNDVDRSFSYYALFTLKRHTELLELALSDSSEELHDSLEYCIGHIRWSMGEKETGAQHLKRHLLKSMERDYPRYITDKADCLVSSFQKVFSLLRKQAIPEETVLFVRIFLIFSSRYPETVKLISVKPLARIAEQLEIAGYDMEAQSLKQFAAFQKSRRKFIFDALKETDKIAERVLGGTRVYSYLRRKAKRAAQKLLKHS